MKKMRRAAKAERRSLNSQAVLWLEERATQWKSVNLRDVVASIRSEREAMFRRHGEGPNSVNLVRSSRRRVSVENRAVLDTNVILKARVRRTPLNDIGGSAAPHKSVKDGRPD